MIEFRQVRKSFFKHGREIGVLRDIDLSIREGEFISFVGPSGCGKSTLLNITAGLMQPTGGTVLYRNAALRDVNSRVGYMTQKDNLLPWRSVTDNIALALDVKGVPAAERQERVTRLVELTGLAGFENHYPSELSGGMRKRVALARTLIYEPETLLMDEPFGAIDAQLRLLLHAELLRIWESTRRTILFITHDLAEALVLSDRIVIMSSRPGRIKAIEEVPLPRPRDVLSIQFQPEFGALFQRLWQMLKHDVEGGERAPS